MYWSALYILFEEGIPLVKNKSKKPPKTQTFPLIYQTYLFSVEKETSLFLFNVLHVPIFLSKQWLTG